MVNSLEGRILEKRNIGLGMVLFPYQGSNEARFARVYGSAGGDQGVLMDAVCMAEGQRCPSLTKQDH